MSTTTSTPTRTTLHVPTPLRRFTDGHATVTVEGRTAGQALNDLADRYPALRTHLYDDQGGLRSFVNVYLNEEDIRFLEKADTPLRAGDALSIVPAIAGGLPDPPRR